MTRRSTIVWLRRDLRLGDNPALAEAAQWGNVIPVFVWCPEEEGEFQPGRASRWWLKHSLFHLDKSLRDVGSRLIACRSSDSLQALLQIARAAKATHLFYNHLYDPVSLVRDHRVRQGLTRAGIVVYSFSGDLLYEPWEIYDEHGQPFTRFSDFWHHCQTMPFEPDVPLPPPKRLRALPNATLRKIASCSVEELGLEDELEAGSNALLAREWSPGWDNAEKALARFLKGPLLEYADRRTRVDTRTTSLLSAHLHFGEISVRRVYYEVRQAGAHNLLLRSAGAGAVPLAGDDDDDDDDTPTTTRTSVSGATTTGSLLFDGARASTDTRVSMTTTTTTFGGGRASSSSGAGGRASSSSSDASTSTSTDRDASAGHTDFLRHLGLRDYSRYLVFHFPFTHDTPLLPHLRHFPWTRNQERFKAWRQGRTGYPLVDAAMRELWATGWLHNALRVAAATFCVKFLRLPWSWGLRHFWDTLLDADLESDVLGWQFVAGGIPDGHALERIDHPLAQGRALDAHGEYVRRWLPELARVPVAWIHHPWDAPPCVLAAAGVELGVTYPAPIVDVAAAVAQHRHAVATMLWHNNNNDGRHAHHQHHHQLLYNPVADTDNDTTCFGFPAPPRLSVGLASAAPAPAADGFVTTESSDDDVFLRHQPPAAGGGPSMVPEALRKVPPRFAASKPEPGAAAAGERVALPPTGGAAGGDVTPKHSAAAAELPSSRFASPITGVTGVAAAAAALVMSPATTATAHPVVASSRRRSLSLTSSQRDDALLYMPTELQQQAAGTLLKLPIADLMRLPDVDEEDAPPTGRCCCF